MAVPNTDNIETTTLRLLRKRIADAIFKANPTAAYFLMNGRVRTASGGRYISEPLMYTTNPNTMTYRGYDRLNVAPTEELTEAQYNWRLAATSISISGEEKLINSGESAQFSMLKAKTKVAEMSFRQWLDEMIHAATTSKNLNKDFLGLDEITDSRLNFSTLGGIDGSTYAFWQNQLGPGGDGTGTMPGGTGTGQDNAPVHITATSTNELRNLLTRMWNNCAKGSPDTPDLILTAQNVYERYDADAFDKRRISDPALAELGFDNIVFKGARMMWNENIATPTDHGLSADDDVRPIYFINSEFMSFTLHTQRNFVMTQFASPWDQDAQVAQILMAGNMTCSNRRRLGVCWVDLSP